MKTIILVVALTGLSIATFGGTVQVSAVPCTNITKTTENPASASRLLTNGQEQSFKLFVELNEKEFVKKQEWHDFLEVISLYNQNTEKFCKLSIEKRVIFANTIFKLQNQLLKYNTIEAKEWNKKLSFTKSTFNFVWNFNSTPNVTPEQSEVEVIQIDTVVSSL